MIWTFFYETTYLDPIIYSCGIERQHSSVLVDFFADSETINIRLGFGGILEGLKVV